VIKAGHPDVSVARCCQLLGVPRPSYYRGPATRMRIGDQELMRRIDRLYMEHPWMGSRSFADQLTSPERPIGRGRIRRLMRIMGIESLAPKPGTSKRHPGHPVYPYLLRGMTINRPNQVWATDITFIPMARGHMYLIAIMDWATRKVLSWRLSNTIDERFCIEALKEALLKYGAPDIFNSDQGCQFTSEAFTAILKAWNVKISMDGKGRFKDNIFIERLWRTLKYERIYLKDYDNGADLYRDLTIWFRWYNEKRKHSSLDKMTPNEAYAQGLHNHNKAA
jgi:putative transposase